MKIALCLSGHTRSLDKTIDSLKKHILSRYDIDVFVATYNQLDILNPSPMDEKLISELSPKAVKYSDNRPLKQSLMVRSKALDMARTTNNVLSMLNQIRICNELKSDFERTNNMTYDIVIRARPDILYKQDLPLSVDSKVHLPRYGHFAGYNDQLAFGSSPKMNVYAEVFDRIDSILTMKMTYVNPELLLKRWLDSKAIETELFDCDYALLRRDGQKLDNKYRAFTGDIIVSAMERKGH